MIERLPGGTDVLLTDLEEAVPGRVLAAEVLGDRGPVARQAGGGEVARYVAQFGQPQGRVAKAVLVSAVPPLMLKTDANPGGTPIAVFDGFRKALAENRAQFFLDVASGPFYGFNRPNAVVSDGVVRNWWRQGMMGSALAHYDGIKAFSETDQTAELEAITVPMLKPATFFVLIISIIGAFQVFDQIYVLTDGGPANSTTMMTYEVYRSAFQNFEMGMASAQSVLLFLMLLVMTVIGRRATKGDEG